MDMSLIWLMLMLFFLLTNFLLIFVMFKGFGIKNCISMSRLKIRKLKQGWGFVRMLNTTGYPENILMELKTDTGFILPYGSEHGKYILKNHCIYNNEYGIPTIDYRKGDADPIDYRIGLQSVTSAKVLENLQARAVKAEVLAGSELEQWLKKNWKTVGIGLLMMFGGLIFVITNMNDSLTSCAMKGAQTVVLNATTLGK